VARHRDYLGDVVNSWFGWLCLIWEEEGFGRLWSRSRQVYPDEDMT
jgi:hypothetical protein